jgi:hypothetical protein
VLFSEGKNAAAHMAFVDHAINLENPLLSKVPKLEQQNVTVCDWCAAHDGKHRDKYRKSITKMIVDMGFRLRKNGAVEKWLADCDAHTRNVVGNLNGPLVQFLVEIMEYADPGVVPMLKGAPLLGEIETSGSGVPKALKPLGGIDELWSDRREITQGTLKSLKPSDLDAEVLKQTLEEARLGRVSQPVRYDQCEFDGVASSRFGVLQNGAVRLIDNGTASRCNPCAGARERIREHRLDTWNEMAKYLYLLGMIILSSCKVDVSAAFKRIPVLAEHRWAAGTLFYADGAAQFIQQYAMPFGFVGSVYSWERLSNFLWSVITVLLFVPLGKYVDDFYGIEHPDHIECALECIVDIFEAVLGPCSLSSKKILFGNPLGLLGFQVFIGPSFTRFALSEDKRIKWLELICGHLASGVMFQREAAQMAGRLAFAAMFIFRRLGRAMLRPIFHQQHHGPRDGRIDLSLSSALEWWQRALEEQTSEDFPFEAVQSCTAEIFCDAAGSPPHICAVIFIDGQSFYCHNSVPDAWLNWFAERNDAQIMGLELLAVLYAILNFLPLIQGRTVRIWTDNEGGRGSMTSGGAREWDHNLLVHKIWEVCFRYCVNPWFDRVPTDDNIADGPTRSDMLVVEALGAAHFSAHVPRVL